MKCIEQANSERQSRIEVTRDRRGGNGKLLSNRYRIFVWDNEIVWKRTVLIFIQHFECT